MMMMIMMMMMIFIYCNCVDVYKNGKTAKSQPKGETIHKTIKKHRILKIENKNTKQKNIKKYYKT
jgi:hypothetical protein